MLLGNQAYLSSCRRFSDAFTVGITRPCADVAVAPSHFGEVGVGFDLLNLLRVALAMSGDEKQPLISVQWLAYWAVGNVGAKIGRGLHERDGFVATGDEMIERFPRRPAAGGHKQIGRASCRERV